MVHMVARLCIVLSCLPLALLGGCSSGSQAPKCIPGASAACACPTGQQGAQVCNPAGTFGACQCSANMPDAAWGAEVAAVAEPDTQTAADVLAASGPEVQADTRPAGMPDAMASDAPSTAGLDLGQDVVQVSRDAGNGQETQPDAAQATDGASTPPDTRAVVDVEPLAPLQPCADYQHVYVAYAEACGSVNGSASPATNMFWPGPLAVGGPSNQCYYGCQVNGGVLTDAGSWTACVSVENITTTPFTRVCVAHDSDCALCTVQAQ